MIFPLIMLGSILIFFLSGGLHKVQEGHIGLYWRGGALMEGYTEPGFHIMIPFITSFSDLQITVQTDLVENIPCGTSGGVMIHFDKIEVVNRLNKTLAYETIKNYTIHYDKTWIFDKIHHEINQFCSKHTLQDVYITKFDTLDDSLVLALQESCNNWAPGIEIIAVRVTKPKIPPNIQSNYASMEGEATKFMIAVEREKVIEKEAETKRKKEIIEARAESEVSKINMQKNIHEHESWKKIQDIENEIYYSQQKSITDSEHYKVIKEIEANKKKISPEFLKFMAISQISENPKTYFGQSLTSYMEQNILSTLSTATETILNQAK